MTIKLGNRLAELRKEHHLSQEELAEKLNVSRQAISKWECGESSPDTDNLIELSKIYNISLDELVGNAPAKEESKDDANRKLFSLSDDEGNKIQFVKGEKDDEDDDEDEDDNEDKNDERNHPIFTTISVIVSCAVTIGVVVAYVLLGTLLGLWGQAWVLFLLIPIIPSLMSSIFYKRMHAFAYPVLVAFVYLMLGMWYPGGYWHPWWLLFLSIPVYYAIAEAIKKIKKIKTDQNQSK